MNYGELIKQSFSIARHHRYLWFFGIFAGDRRAETSTCRAADFRRTAGTATTSPPRRPRRIP
ncbi:MAG: hypothetical protein WKF31_10135 [Thermoleophilaceae bacterium]